MIRPNATLSIRVVPLAYIQVREYQRRDIEDVEAYYRMLLRQPEDFLGLLYLVPSDTHKQRGNEPRLYTLLDGHRRFCAYILAGRTEALCVVEEE